MLKEIDQRIYTKFCLKNEIKRNKVCEMLTTAYDESARSKTTVYEWYKCFLDGRENEERPRHPITSTIDANVEKMSEMVMNNR